MWDWISKLNELKQSGEPAIMVTVVKCAGSTPQTVGAKMLVMCDGKFFGTIGGGKLEELALKEAHSVFDQQVAKTTLYPLCIKTGQCCGGSMEVLMEVINQNANFYLFGAGHVGQAVCQTLVGTPFVVHLIDEREEWINANNLPANVVRHKKSWQDFMQTSTWDKSRTYACVMTHSHLLDEEIIQHLVEKPAKYIGLIGSKTKWERFQMRLKNKGIDQDALNRVKCPIGIDIGGKAPKEVAISLAAELVQTYYDAQ